MFPDRPFEHIAFKTRGEVIADSDRDIRIAGFGSVCYVRLGFHKNSDDLMAVRKIVTLKIVIDN